MWMDFPDMPIGNSTGDTAHWHHYAVVWNAGKCTNYLDGVVVTNMDFSVATTTLRIAQNSSAVPRWLGVGVNPHGGTPLLEDEIGEDYPNNGWFNGKMDDLRIYNRALSVGEIQSMVTRPPLNLRRISSN